MTKIKVCGLRRAEDIAFANELQPDYIGFVFAKASKRYVSAEQAAELRRALSREIKAVGVFVDEPIEHILALLNSGVIDAAQLHGGESMEDVLSLKQRTDRKVIQAFRVESRQDVARAAESPADFILLDHGGGGTGETFDWSLIEHIDRPFFLAGGLSAENVGAAVLRCRPFAVDSSSKLETDGIKDYEKMKAFVEAVRQKG